MLQVDGDSQVWLVFWLLPSLHCLSFFFRVASAAQDILLWYCHRPLNLYLAPAEKCLVDGISTAREPVHCQDDTSMRCCNIKFLMGLRVSSVQTRLMRMMNFIFVEIVQEDAAATIAASNHVFIV